MLGVGNGMATLARATAIADLYGGASQGTINSVAAAGTTGARAAGPVAAAVYAAAAGYGSLLWTLVGISAIVAFMAYRASGRLLCPPYKRGVYQAEPRSRCMEGRSVRRRTRAVQGASQPCALGVGWHRAGARAGRPPFQARRVPVKPARAPSSRSWKRRSWTAGCGSTRRWWCQ